MMRSVFIFDSLVVFFFYLSKPLFSGFLQFKVILYAAKITQNNVTELLIAQELENSCLLRALRT